MTRNTARILDAAVGVAADAGWAGLSLSGVGRSAGLSIRPLIVRYGDRSTLAAAVWHERTGPALQTSLGAALAAAGLLGGAPDAAAFAAAMTALAHSSPALDAAAELLIASPFDEPLHAAVTETTGAQVGELLRHPLRGAGRSSAARRAYVIALGLGLIATSRRPSIKRLSLDDQWSHLAAALRTEQPPVRLPRAPRPPFLAYVRFDTGDATLDDLLRSALALVAQRGYEAATVAEIAADAGVAPATALLRHPTKQALFIDAVARLQAIALREHHAAHAVLVERHGDAIATAARIRAAMHPDDAPWVSVDLERVRLTWHDPSLAEQQEEALRDFAEEMRRAGTDPATFASDADVHVSHALGVGIELLQVLDPTAWDLPYDVVTIPLAASEQRR